MRKKILSIVILLGAIAVFSQVALAAYVPLEDIPGSTKTEISTFPGYVKAIYKFAIWSVGISALLMISIGGFMYFTAAGNSSKMEGGKKVIADALYGLIAVLVAWLILNTINPDLVNINLDSVTNLKTTQ